MSRINRKGLLRTEIAQLREIAFPAPLPSDPFARERLEMERTGIVRARVLLDCALVEEATALIIMHRVLWEDPVFSRLKYFGRFKRYRVLANDVLGRLTARNKISVVKKFVRIPKNFAETLDRMLAMRDVLAHVFTLPEDAGALRYKGESVLTTNGFERYYADSSAVLRWLVEKVHYADALAAKRSGREARGHRGGDREQRSRSRSP